MPMRGSRQWWLKGHGLWDLGSNPDLSINNCDLEQVKESLSLYFLICETGIKIVSTSTGSWEEGPAMHKHNTRSIAILMMIKPRLLGGVTLSWRS